MTNKELIVLLLQQPEDAPVIIRGDTQGFAYSDLNEDRIKYESDDEGFAALVIDINFS